MLVVCLPSFAKYYIGFWSTARLVADDLNTLEWCPNNFPHVTLLTVRITRGFK